MPVVFAFQVPPTLLLAHDLLLASESPELRAARRLDLGSGPRPEPGYWGLDHRAAPGVTALELVSGLPWPFADGSIEELYSSHFIEHVPAHDIAAYEFVPSSAREDEHAPRSAVPTGLVRYVGACDALSWVMDEACRVCRPGAHFRLRWPALEDVRTGSLGRIAFLDPTHRRFIPLEQLAYFSRAGREQLGVSQYPIACDWRLVEKRQVDIGLGFEHDVTLVKPIPVGPEQAGRA